MSLTKALPLIPSFMERIKYCIENDKAYQIPLGRFHEVNIRKYFTLPKEKNHVAQSMPPIELMPSMPYANTTKGNQ